MAEIGTTYYRRRWQVNQGKSVGLIGLITPLFLWWTWVFHQVIDYFIVQVVTPEEVRFLTLRLTKSLTVKSSIFAAVGATSGPLIVAIQEILKTLKKSGSSLARVMGGIPLENIESVLSAPSELAQANILRNIVNEARQVSGLTELSVHILPHEPGFNSLTVGFRKSDSVIILTGGTFKELSPEELHALIYHETVHILNGDQRFTAFLDGRVDGFGALIKIVLNPKSTWLGLLLLPSMVVVGLGGYLSCLLLLKTFRRRQEYQADAGSTRFTRDPRLLAQALIKIQALEALRLAKFGLKAELVRKYRPILKEIKPSRWFDGLFQSYPPITRRIQKLWPEWDGQWPDLTKDQVELFPASPGQRGDHD
ncbi:MAG: M48 family metalloprotease [Deltaproteobacteria bacterium]|jgi:Zn-dependent protease with chaperone function|nr:M48 family metalloprotease [Deltaproteobacteria bacterium]